MRYKYLRLSTMMFLQLFILGCIMPIFSLYMRDNLHFSGHQIGLILAMTAVPSLLSPLIGAFIADRIISAEKLLAICNFSGAFVMVGLYSQTGFYPVLFFYLLYGLITGPTFALATTISFHHAPDAVKSFGSIRLWGTLGWIAAGWVFSFIWTTHGSQPSTTNLQGAFQLSALFSIILGIYALTLPVGLKRKKDKVILIPKDSLNIILKPEIISLAILCIIITFADRFYMFGAAPYLKSIGYSEKSIMPILGIGQIPEIIGLFILGLLLKTIGLKKTLLFGTFFELTRFALFIYGKNDLFLFMGISLHGLTYAFFFIPVTIFLDCKSDKSSRAGVHLLFSIITGGLGSFAGNIAAGYAADLTTIAGTNQINFTFFWITPMALSAIGVVSVLFFLKEQPFMRDEKAIVEV
jgi:nucleoside transporter